MSESDMGSIKSSNDEMSWITYHEGDIIQLKMPLPFSLRWVNSYAVRGRGGWTIIDPGMHTPETEAQWALTQEALGLRWEDVEQIVLTHHHPDHYGMAGWLQERTGSPVLLSKTGLAQAQLLWGEGQPMTARLTELFARHGMPAQLLEAVTQHMASFVTQVSPQPQVTLLAPGQTLRLGDVSYEAMETPGHAAGHLCFYDAAAQRIFCGDQVMPQISPNVSFFPGVEANPLSAYLHSLQELKPLQVTLAFPGHRDPFSTFGERCTELILHHQQRLLQMLERIQREPMTGYALCHSLFSDRLTTHQLRFAMAETIAHLVYLQLEGKLSEEERDGEIVFSVR
jgi:glyoxylase-like metal-dependent hydrolase (beta-lactamase superfamily II)